MLEYVDVLEIANKHNISSNGLYDKSVEILFDSEQYNLKVINQLIPFIKSYLPNKIKTFNKRWDSRMLSKLFAYSIGNHLNSTIGEFIIAMIYCGFKYKISSNGNVEFNVSEKDVKILNNLRMY